MITALRSSTPVSLGRVLLILTLWLAAALGSVPGSARESAPASDVTEAANQQAPLFDARVVKRGHYSISAQQDFDATPDVLSQLILDVEAQCKRGCRYFVPEISRAVITQREPKRLVTWTHVDSLLDASYFTVITTTDQDNGLSIVFETPDATDIEQWSTKELAHDPFFHLQRVVWRLDELHDPSGTVSATRVSLDMEMHSDRALINLMPGQVLAGAQRHLEQMFEHLQGARPSTAVDRSRD